MYELPAVIHKRDSLELPTMATVEVPPTMHAWMQTTAGQPHHVLKLTKDHPTPKIGAATDVLVRITHAALNPGGSIMMQLCPSILRAKPGIPELDFSGIVVAVGSDIPGSRKLAPGDHIFGSVPVGRHIKTGAGALAEYIVVAGTDVVRKPDNISFEKASGLGVAGCTALILIESAKLSKGNRVLVNGAMGGIGTMVTQLAKEAVGEGGRIIAVCRYTNADTVKRLGADEVGILIPCASFWLSFSKDDHISDIFIFYEKLEEMHPSIRSFILNRLSITKPKHPYTNTYQNTFHKPLSTS